MLGMEVCVSMEVEGSTPDLDEGLLLSEITGLLADLEIESAREPRMSTDLAGSYGLDSLALVELHDRLERAFHVRLPEQVLEKAITPADWLEAIGKARTSAAQPAHQKRCDGRAPQAVEPGPEGIETLTEALAWHAETHPERITIRLLGASAGGSPENVSYGELARAAAAAARGLRTASVSNGDRVALMLPTGRQYFETFLGVLLAGGTPVPIYPPARRSMLEEHLRRQSYILDNAGATVLVTVPEALMAARLIRPLVPSLRRVRTPQSLSTGAALSGPTPALAAGECALIQYTSGSTGDPKGVALTHAQLLGNISAMGQAAAATTADVFVSWLPLYHDMGLIGAWLAAMVLGFPLVVMSPLSFLSRPASWLEAVSAYGGTISAAPNFAFEACVDRIPDSELGEFDLTSWRLAFNGSEPILASTMDRFIGRFGRCGFQPEAMCPAYGLAEMGLGATFTPLGRGPRVDFVDRAALQEDGLARPAPPHDARARSVVSCGIPLPGCQIRITAEDGSEVADRHEGTVECRGPSATRGYFANEAANQELWRGDWLNTGDLGYITGGELYLTGRAKDLIIRGGRNLHPEELEQAVSRLPGVLAGAVAVFASADDRLATERLVVVAETPLRAPDRRSELEAQIRRKALDVLGSTPDQIVLTGRGTIPRTPGGKIRRADTRDAFTAGRLGRRPSPFVVQFLRLAWSGWRSRERHPGGGLIPWCYALYVWVLVVLIGVPTWLAVLLPVPLRIRWGFVRAAILALARLSGINIRIEGAFPPPRTPVVIVANHPSFVDGAALMAASPDPVAFVASTDLQAHPIFGVFLRRLGCVFVERESATASSTALEKMTDTLRGKRRLAVFPEGSIGSGLRPFHLGAFEAAVTAARPVVPVRILGTGGVLSPGRYRPRRHGVTVSIGRPLSVDGEGFEAEIKLRDASQKAVVRLSANLT